MYFAMDDMGDENIKKLTETHGETEKWRFVHQIASTFGFSGIQVSPKYRDKFGFSVTSVPDFIHESFRVTYHPGGVYQLNTTEEEQAVNRLFSESLEIGVEIGTEDVSFHPPVIADVSRLPLPKEEQSSSRCNEAKDRLRSLLSAWLPRFRARGITLSLETHSTPHVFVFEGLRDFRYFFLSLPGLDVLVDVSHNCYDGYQISEVLAIVEPLTITGFHLSDAITGKELYEGTHLPIGKGHVDFRPLLARFKGNDAIYGALEVRGPAQGIADSLARLRTFDE